MEKYLLNKWDVMYGVYPGLYIGRYVKVHKNLSIVKGCYASPADYNTDEAPKNAMGWDGLDENPLALVQLRSQIISQMGLLGFL